MVENVAGNANVKLLKRLNLVAYLNSYDSFVATDNRHYVIFCIRCPK